MKQLSKKRQLWRADLVHRNGYQAPYQLVEVEPKLNLSDYKNAHNQVNKMGLRLLNFPDKWSFRLTKLEKEKINGKWY